MKRIATRFFCLALLGAVLLSTLVSCGYPQIDPTAEEAETVMRMGDFEITLDMFRAEFFKARTAVDGGRAEYWNGMTEEEKASWMRRLTDEATRSLAELYAPLSLAKKEGIDPFGGEVNRLVSQGRTDAINGLAAEDKYGAYLVGLKEVYFTDHVFRMNLRSTACIEKLESKLCNKGGALYPTTEALYDYFLGEDTVAVIWMYREVLTSVKSEEEILSDMDALRRRALAECDTAAEMRNFFGARSNLQPYELTHGYYMGKEDSLTYSKELAEIAHSLAEGEMSEAVRDRDGVYVLYRVPKKEGHVKDDVNYGDYLVTYLEQKLYGEIYREADLLLSSAVYGDLYRTLTFDTVLPPLA
jgi:hypothetical protein